MTPKYRPILWWPPKNIHKIFIPPKKIFFWNPQKILKFKIWTQKNNPSQSSVKISEYPPPLDDIKLLRKREKYIFSQAVARYWMIYLSLYDDVAMMASGKNELLLQFFFNE